MLAEMAAKVLYVEDNDDNVYLLSRRLKRNGYDVVIAKDGQSAIDMAVAEKPDIILMDLNIPVIDGWEATRRLKATEETKSVPVIALTSHAMAGDREAALNAGCDDYDTKPIDFARLQDKMTAVLSGHAPDEE
jgi:two-component system cell cycle response regulator DivK